MKVFFLSLVFFIISGSSCLSQQVKKTHANDLKVLAALPVKWEHYWNCHNVDSMVTMLRDDVDFITVAGTSLKGKAATANDLKQEHKSAMLGTSRWKMESVDIKYLKPNAATIFMDFSLIGYNDTNGTPQPSSRGMFNWLLIKKKNQWKLRAAHIVNLKKSVAPAA